MSTAITSALLVVLLGVRLQPRPVARRPRCQISRPHIGVGTALSSVHRWRPARVPDQITAAEVGAWCEALARAARSGSTLTEALREVPTPASCAPSVDAVSLAISRGRGLADALDVRVESSHLSLALGVLHAIARNGGHPAEPLDRAASTLRSRALAASERRTQSAQARLSAVVMTVLPVAMLGLLLLTSTTTRAAVAAPLGTFVVAVGVALNLVGWRWMRRIISGRPA